MRISQRLFLAVIPAIVGVFVLVALVYWGDLDRQAPEWFVLIAAVSVVLSLLLAWQNTRYVARRIERLAGHGGRPSHPVLSPLGLVRSATLPRLGASPDELDSIENVVDHLSNAVTLAEAGRRAQDAAVAERMREYAVLLAEAATAVRSQLDEGRLALHILHEGHFGTLNDQQEELVAAARSAADAADAEATRLDQIAKLDRDGLAGGTEAIRVGEMLRSLRPQLDADAAGIGVTLTIDVAPGLPRLTGDRLRLQRALELLLRHLVRHSLPGGALRITADADPTAVRIVVAGAAAPTLDADIALARRIIEGHGGSIEVRDGMTEVLLPGARAIAGAAARAD